VQATVDRNIRPGDVACLLRSEIRDETGDFLGKDRALCIAPGDLLAVRTAGAYGFSMSSTYNSRPRAAEVMVDGAETYLVREREGIEDLMAGERQLPL